MPARPTQKSLPAPRSTTMSEVLPASPIILVSRITISSVTALPRSGALSVMRRIGPSCFTRISSAILVFLQFQHHLLAPHLIPPPFRGRKVVRHRLPPPKGGRVGVR